MRLRTERRGPADAARFMNHAAVFTFLDGPLRRSANLRTDTIPRPVAAEHRPVGGDSGVPERPTQPGDHRRHSADSNHPVAFHSETPILK